MGYRLQGIAGGEGEADRSLRIRQAEPGGGRTAPDLPILP